MAKLRIKSKRSLLLQLLLVAGFIFVAAPLLLAAVLRAPATREYARQQAEQAIRAELGLSAVIRDVDIEPSLAIVASGITLDHPQHGRFVEAKVLRIRPSWWALLRGKVDLHTITIDKASVWLVFRDGKLINGPTTRDTASSGKPSVDLPFDKLWVKRSRLVVDAGNEGSGELSSIEVFLDSRETEVLGVTLSSPTGIVRHRAGTDEIQRLAAMAKITNENVQVELLRLTSPEVAVTVRQASFGLPLGSSYRGSFDVSVQLSKLEKWPLPVKLPHLEGDVRVQAKLAGDAEGPSGEAKISMHRVVLDQYGFGENVELALKLDHKVVSFEGQAQLIRNGGAVNLAGSVALVDGLPLTVHADIDDVEFAKLMEQLGVSANAIVDWKLAGSWDLSGTLDPLDLKGPLRMPTRDFHVMRDAWHVKPVRDVIGVASANLSGTVAINLKGIVLSNIDVGMRNSKLHVQEVLLGFDNQLRVRATSDLFNLMDVTPLVDFPIAGHGSFDVNVEGEFQDPKVGGKMRFDEFAFASFAFGNVETDFSLEKEFMAVRFPSVVMHKEQSVYTANDFVIDFSDHKLAIDAKLAVERLAMQDFYHVFHYENDERYTGYQGLVSGDASIRYTMGFPGDSPHGTMLANMDLDVSEVELSGFRFQRGHFDGSWNWLDHTQGYRGGLLTVDRFSLQKGRGTINLSGKMLPGGTLDMVAVGDKISVRETEGLSERLPDLAGSFGITGTIKGQAAAPRAEIELAATGLSYAGESLGDARTYVRLTNQSDPWVSAALAWTPQAPPASEPCAHAREGLARGSWPPDPPMHTASGLQPALDAPMAYLVCGQALDGRVLFDMAIGRTRAYPLRGDLRFAAFPFGKLMPRHGKQKPAQGVVSGLLRLRGGAVLTPAALAGELRLDALEVGQSGVTLKNDGPAIASFEAGRFTIERAAFVGPSSALTVRGGGSLDDGLGLELSGSLDLGILPSFSHELQEASGKLDLDFKISGQVDHPAVFGQARVTKAALRFAQAAVPLEAIDGRVTFSAQRIILEGWSAQALGGKLTLEGAAALSGRGIGNYRFDIGAEDLSVRPREGVDLKVGGQTTLAWKEGERLPKLGGVLRLSRVHYTRPITMGRTIGDLTKKERADVETYDPERDMLALDLRVVETEPMHIDNNFIDAELAIDDSKEPFKLVGTDQRFGLLGHVSVRRGTVRLRDRAFDIRDGEIAFDSATRVQPNFDVHAVTDVRRKGEFGQTNWHIGVHAWGTPESFQFRLTSDPFLSEDDIALLLTVGMTHTELAQLQTSDVTGTAALEALATVTGVEREVQRALPAIDDVHIASSYSERSNRTEPQLHLGKRIADRVRLDASTGLSESRDFSTGVEYQISDKTSVGAVYNNQTSTSASQIGDVGVDLKWRLEFD